jgi:tetratricopeptide (TPR) repeat protein
MSDRRDDDRTAFATTARHWERAGDTARAAAAFYDAAERAAEVYAYEESVEHCARTLELSSDPHVVRGALLLAESVHATTGGRDKQRRTLAALEELLQRTPDDALAWELLRRQAMLARATDDLASEVGLLARVRERATGSNEPERLAESEKLHAFYWFAVNDYARAAAAALAALALFERLGDGRSEIETLCLLSRIESEQGDLDKTRAHLERARAQVGKHDRSALVNATLAASFAASRLEDFRAAVDLASEGLELARSSGNKARECDALNSIGLSKTVLCDFSGARSALTEARDLFGAIGKPSGVASSTLNLGLLEWRIGALDAAYGHVSNAVAGFRSVEKIGHEILAVLNLSGLCTYMGRYQEAVALAETALRLSQEAAMPRFTISATYARGFAERSSGDLAAAIPHLEEALAGFYEHERRVDVLETLDQLALAHILLGKNAEALALVEKLLASPARDLESGLWPQSYYWTAAQVYRRCGDDKRAARALQAAVAAAAALEAHLRAGEETAAFAALPINAAIRLAARKGQWPAMPASVEAMPRD